MFLLELFSFVFLSAVVCGIPAITPRGTTDPGRIVGGEEVIPYSWPWQMALIEAGQFISKRCLRFVTAFQEIIDLVNKLYSM